MRDPKRIKRILELVEKIWKENPDLRLTQLIMNVLSMNADPYYIEDDRLERELKTFIDLQGSDLPDFSDLAHEIWAASQLLPEEGIEDGVNRIQSLLQEQEINHEK